MNNSHSYPRNPLIMFFTAAVIVSAGFFNALSQPVSISFTNKTYANDSIFVYCYSDYITETPRLLTAGKVDNNGLFNCSFNSAVTLNIFIPLNLFRLSMFTEPGRAYKIRIPNKKMQGVENELNPFFTPVDIIPGILNSDSTELNYLINSFDEVYDMFVAKNFYNMYYYARKSVPDSAITDMEKKFSYDNNAYFRVYKEYKFNMLRYMAYERDENFIIKYKFNNTGGVYAGNPSYMAMFNALFKHYFSLSVKKKWGSYLFEDIAKAKSPFAISQTLKNNPAISNDTLISLIILKGLHDAFYAAKLTEYFTFPRHQLLMTLDSMICCAIMPRFREIAANIKSKVTVMEPGTDAPDFSLPGHDSVVLSLSEFRGKYLYINFYDIRSYTAPADMLQMKYLAEKFSKTLDIITITPNSVHSVAEFRNKQEFSWYFLASAEKKLLDKYNVKAFPSFYLIDPYGKIILSPAPDPEKNFESIFISILQKRN